MSASLYAKEKQFAVAIVRRVCALTSSLCNNLGKNDVLTKCDLSPVTIGDISAQAVINTMLSNAFPEDAIVAEEDATEMRQESSKPLRDRIVQLANETLTADLRPGDDPGWGIGPGNARTTEELLDAIDRGSHSGGPTGRIWTVDPIDGTKGFLQGEQYAVSLALIVDAQVQVGVIGCPNLPVDLSDKDSPRGCIFAAARGQGAFQLSLSGLNPIPISIPTFTPSTLNFLETFTGLRWFIGHVSSTLGITRASLKVGSMTRYCLLARGDGGIYLYMPDITEEETIWDHASGVVLIEEAGGVITDSRGECFDFGLGRTLGKNFGVVAAGREVHAKVLEILKQAQKSGGGVEESGEA